MFLAGAGLKAHDINLFTVQIAHYGVIAKPSLLSVTALSTLWMETALGIALVLRFRLRGAVFAIVLCLLAVFTGLIAYGLAFHDIQDCGCFGAIEMSPGISIAKNVLLAFLCAIAWWGHLGTPHQRQTHLLLLVKIVACLVFSCTLVGYTYATLETVSEDPRPFAQFVFEEEGVPWNLGTGEYFVAMLDMTCEHCMASVESLNELSLTPDFLPIIGLCYEEEQGGMENFRQVTNPVFPLHSLGDQIRTFFSFVGDAPPRFFYVRDGAPVKFWDESVPDISEVIAVHSVEH